MRSQPSIPNFVGSRPNDLSCSFNAASFCSACASAAMIGIQPSPSRAARVTAASDEPPNQMGIGCCRVRDFWAWEGVEWSGSCNPLVSRAWPDPRGPEIKEDASINR
jgi:hypothetical protein